MSRNGPTVPLSGCFIATSGRFPGPRTTQAAFQQRIRDLGGDLVSKVTAETSILIATHKELQSQSTKVAAAIANDIPIVSLDWLMQIESSGAKADEKLYLLNSPTNQTAPVSPKTSAPAAANSKKRAASPSTPNTQDQSSSQPKRHKTSKDEIKNNGAKVGDGGNANSKKLAVSVDECCPLSSSPYEVYIDDNGLIWDASLNQTNASANNNKFYKVQVRIKQGRPM